MKIPYRRVSPAVRGEISPVISAASRSNGCRGNGISFITRIQTSSGYAMAARCRFYEESDPNGIRTHFEVFAALRNSPQTRVRLRVRGENANRAVCTNRAD